MNGNTTPYERLVGISALGVASLLALMALGFGANAANADSELFYDGFESGSSTEWTLNEGWDISDSDPSEGDYKAFTSETVEGDYNILEVEASTEGYEDIELWFDYQVENLETGDEILVQVRTNGTWETVQTFDEGDETDDWASSSIMLENDADDNESFMFRFVSDLNSETDAFHLDEVYLRGTSEEGDDDDDMNDDLLSVIEHIRVSYEDGGSDVEVHMDLDAEDRDEVVETLAMLLGLSEDDIDDLIRNDDDDDDNGNGDHDNSDNDDHDNGDDNGDNGHKDDDDSDTEGAGIDDLQAIYVYVWDDTTGVELDFDYTFEWLSFDTTDKDEIVERTAEYLDADEDDVEELMVFED